jgi:hypothetical protein
MLLVYLSCALLLYNKFRLLLLKKKKKTQEIYFGVVITYQYIDIRNRIYMIYMKILFNFMCLQFVLLFLSLHNRRKL